jgi:hypothetical protein
VPTLRDLVRASDQANTDLRALGGRPGYQRTEAEVRAAAERASRAHEALQVARAEYLSASPERQHEMELG